MSENSCKNDIIKINSHNIDDLKYINLPNEPFQVIGKLIPCYNDGIWSATEEIFDESYEKTYNDDFDYINNDFIKNDDTAVFLYFCDNIYAGNIIIWKHWNKDCHIENIAVRKDFRRQGIGKKLIGQAVIWAKEKNLKGLRLETQDTNLIACRFYQRCEFTLGSADTFLYRNFDNHNEKALFWYLLF
jgi:ribosomal protein S18 acetylase RimI-like enzyme